MDVHIKRCFDFIIFTKSVNTEKNERPKDRKTERPKDRKTERPKDRKTERPKDRKNERTKERKNERTKERKNERMLLRNIKILNVHCFFLVHFIIRTYLFLFE